ncbi:MAG: tripartite tricarboxylate transporter substrate binding protein [Betaproteobacteria bacterium]|nr:tripartite tricarboxylate transporter substrate binding protein [Betaproteobacteria bacterium]
MNHPKRAGIAGLAGCVLLAVAAVAHAQEFPTKPIRLIVPFATGGVTDTSGRVIADKLTRQLGQQVIVENRPGGSGNPGTAAVAQMPADGYTLLMGFDGTMVINPFVFPKIPFDTLRDFMPVTKLGDAALVLAAHPSVPARNLAELLAYSKANPGKLSFGHSGTGGTTHVAGELLKQRTGLDMTHIPYKSGGQAVTDAVGGQVPLAYAAVAGAQGHLRSGRLVAIGVSTPKRLGSLPDIPTFIEQGVAGFDVSSWVGILVPIKTPRPVVDKLQREIATVLRDPDTRERFAALGIEPVGNTPEQFTEQIKVDLARWAKVVEQAKIRVD